jgi:glycosyltransferase involved in cell wall biosynthesis
MKIVVLTSTYPSLTTGTAVNIALATLLQSLAKLGNEVSWVSDLPLKEFNHDKSVASFMADSNVSTGGDFSNSLIQYPYYPPFSTLDVVRRAYLPSKRDCYPQFKDPKSIAQKLLSVGTQLFIIFWDSHFELLLPYLKSVPSIYYGARPNYEAPRARLKNEEMNSSLKKEMVLKMLKHQERRHLARVLEATYCFNICNVDAAYYRNEGIFCEYLPNLWPDHFGEKWSSMRQKAEGGRTGISILGNISDLGATGNLFGMRFLANSITPLLELRLKDIDWSVSITGGGELAEDLVSAFSGDRFTVTGFVDNLDHEILAHPVFLLLNNAGPYSGGYTRVIYAMSSGACLVAHSSLADSMPEVRHGENALLGNSAEEISGLIEKACRNIDLRNQIGHGARQTYELEYNPEIVARNLISGGQTAT